MHEFPKVVYSMNGPIVVLSASDQHALGPGWFEEPGLMIPISRPVPKPVEVVKAVPVVAPPAPVLDVPPAAPVKPPKAAKAHKPAVE